VIPWGDVTQKSPGRGPCLLIAPRRRDWRRTEGGRDARVTGPRARPPTQHPLLTRTLSHALAAHWLQVNVTAFFAAEPDCERLLNQNVLRPTALLSGSSSLAACGARVMTWRQPGRRFNKLSVCLHRVSPLLVRPFVGGGIKGWGSGHQHIFIVRKQCCISSHARIIGASGCPTA
jgi:hypothetical protein